MRTPRAYQINPNYAAAIIVLAFAEATTGLAREAEAHAKTRAASQSKGSLYRNRPPRFGDGTFHAAQLRRSRALVRIRNPGFASCTDPPCPDDRVQCPGWRHGARTVQKSLCSTASHRASSPACSGVRIEYSRARRTWSTFWTASASRDFVTDRRHRAFLLPTSVVGTELTIRNVRSSVPTGVKRTRYAQREFFAF